MAASDQYTAAIESGVQVMDEWMAANGITSLPDSVWDLPKECPLWTLGLSYAQAGGIHAQAKAKLQKQGW